MGRNENPAAVAAAEYSERVADARASSLRHESRHRLCVPRDHDLVALLHPAEEAGELRLGLMHADVDDGASQTQMLADQISQVNRTIAIRADATTPP